MHKARIIVILLVMQLYFTQIINSLINNNNKDILNLTIVKSE
jgi:hypothetical protein